MFSFISKTWNPLCGECQHKCVGCWVIAYAKRLKMSKYQGDPRIDEKQINRKFKKGDFVFVQTMSDLFADNVPRNLILRVLFRIAFNPDTKFLLLTKNPKRYLQVLSEIPENCIIGATIETNRIMPKLSKAQNRRDRLFFMIQIRKLTRLPLFVSIEPILECDRSIFAIIIGDWIKPWAVAVGYDNYNNQFPEPSLEKTIQLIETLEQKYGIKVYRKTLREPKHEGREPQA